MSGIVGSVGEGQGVFGPPGRVGKKKAKRRFSLPTPHDGAAADTRGWSAAMAAGRASIVTSFTSAPS